MMKRIRFSAIFVLAILGCAAASLSHAQATRTWVSGVGDDVNPCSRTAPCKTFAGAISKTAAGGEISVLDPGGYGAVTITKSMTIDGGTGAGWASILNSGTTGVIINAGVNDVVTLRNISINGGTAVGPGIAGIRILSAKKVFIEEVQIFNQGGANPNGRGISDTRTIDGQLFISNTIIRNNSQSGIAIVPVVGVSLIDATITNTQVKGNGNAGIAVTAGAHVNISNSVLAGNGTGLFLDQAVGNTQVSVVDTVINDNATGINLSTGTPTLILSGVSVIDNDSGMLRGTGPVNTFNNNRFTGNAANNGPFSPGFATVNPL